MSIEVLRSAIQANTARLAEVGGPAAAGGAGDFGARMQAAIQRVDEAQRVADDKLSALAAGDDVDIHGTMIALQEADITLRTMVSVRDKVVEAYQQVMNMSI